jgi:hypothetical protein
MASVSEDASRLVVGFMEGKADQAQVVQQLSELNSTAPEAITGVFASKANLVLQQAGAGHFQKAQRAGSALVTLAVGIDKDVAKTTAPAQQKCSTSIKVGKALLDAVINMTGAPANAPKDKAQRAQVASFVSELAVHVPAHGLAKECLLEFAEDKIPAIREKALQGLRHTTPDDKVIHRFMVCMTDNSKEVRAAAVASISPSNGRGCLASLLARLDDTESCVRETLFNTLAKEPKTVELFGPGILSRLVVGLHDRNHLVQEAAKKAVQEWVEHLGGPVQLLAKCDLFSDEFLGEDCASQLAQHCRKQSVQQARQWLRSGGQCFPGLESRGALLSRFALGLMSDGDRDDVADIPAVLKMIQDALSLARQSPSKDDFLLRQMLQIASILDICDEVSRRHLLKLTIDVLTTTPISEVSDIPEIGNRMKATVHSTVDLAILLLRKFFGIERTKGRKQSQENLCSERVMAIINEIKKSNKCESEGHGDPEETGDVSEPHFVVLSQEIEAIKSQVAELDERRASAAKAKQEAIAEEDFGEAHRLKGLLASVEAELTPLKVQHDNLLAERDGICHRILAILAALLKWTQSDIRKDGVLLGMFTGLVQPIFRMKAISEEVSLRNLHAIGMFSSIDVELAQYHWALFTKLVQRLSDQDSGKTTEGTRTNLRRAMLAAATLSDCARIHGLNGLFDRDQVLNGASVLSVVPYEFREVSIYPLCGWFMSFGALYFEEHMTTPMPEITWALGWMLSEAFSNKVHESSAATPEASERSEQDSESSLKTVATDIMVFFNILAKHPGRHGEAMLCLAVESVIESGLWRRAVNLPTDAHNLQFARGFSWPKLFEFVRIRLPQEMQLRLWRCCLQVCVTSPALAPWAQIPLALAAGVSNAPPGAAELVKTAVTLGADADALAPILHGLPPLDGVELSEQADLLKPRAAAMKAEQARVAELEQLGVKIAEWTPAYDMKVPKGKPSIAVDGPLRAVAMRSVVRAKRSANTRSREAEKVLLVPESMAVVAAVATPARASLGIRSHRPATVPASVPLQKEVVPEVKTRGTKRLHSKTKPDDLIRDVGDLD